MSEKNKITYNDKHSIVAEEGWAEDVDGRLSQRQVKPPAKTGTVTKDAIERAVAKARQGRWGRSSNYRERLVERDE